MVADSVHGSTADLPTVWNRTDEWYNFDRSPRGRQPETTANVKVIDQETMTTTVVATIDVYAGQPTGSNQEDGLAGIALDPDFATNNWVYLYYAATGTVPCPPTESDGVTCGPMQLSRFTLTQNGLEDEQVLLQIPTQREECCHLGGR